MAIQEVHPGRIQRLGGYLELDGRTSWAPRRPARYQPINLYLIRERNQSFVVDTGLPSQRDLIIGELRQTLPADLPLYVILTRQEMICAGNLAAINALQTIKEVIATPGGGNNPFNAFDSSVSATATIRQTSMDPDTVVAIPPSGSLYTFSPLIRVNVTAWLYDLDTRTLFTSDLFGHCTVPAPDATPIVDAATDEATFEDVRDATLMKFFWLESADKKHYQTWLEKVFSSLEVETIAPTTGAILHGKSVIERHYDLVQKVIGLGR